jgi:hypothetical protein
MGKSSHPARDYNLKLWWKEKWHWEGQWTVNSRQTWELKRAMSGWEIVSNSWSARFKEEVVGIWVWSIFLVYNYLPFQLVSRLVVWIISINCLVHDHRGIRMTILDDVNVRRTYAILLVCFVWRIEDSKYSVLTADVWNFCP